MIGTRKLTPRETYVAEQRLYRTLRSVGESLGISGNRVRQIQGKAIRKLQNFPGENKDWMWIFEEVVRFDRAKQDPTATQKEPIWFVVLKIRNHPEGLHIQSDAWSFRHDLSDIDKEFFEVIRKVRPKRITLKEVK